MNDLKRMTAGYVVGFGVDVGMQSAEILAGNKPVNEFDITRSLTVGWFYGGSSVISGAWADTLRSKNQRVTWWQTDGRANTFRLFPQFMVSLHYRWK